MSTFRLAQIRPSPGRLRIKPKARKLGTKAKVSDIIRRQAHAPDGFKVISVDRITHSVEKRAGGALYSEKAGSMTISRSSLGSMSMFGMRRASGARASWVRSRRWRPRRSALAQTAPAPDKVVATVNGAPIKESDLKIAEQDIGSQLPIRFPRLRGRDYLDPIHGRSEARCAGSRGRRSFRTRPISRERVEYFREKILLDDLMLKEGDEGRHARSAQEAL